MGVQSQIAEKLRTWMAEDPWLNTAQKLEARSGVGASTILRIRREEQNPTADVLDSLARAFGRAAGDFFDGPHRIVEDKQRNEYLSLSASEKALVQAYRAATPDVRACIDSLAKTIEDRQSAKAKKDGYCLPDSEACG